MSKYLILLPFAIIILLTSCSNIKKKFSSLHEPEVITNDDPDARPVAEFSFNRIDISGAVKVVVFIRDTCRVEINDKMVRETDDRCSVENGLLKIAPIDTLLENKIQSVRIYLPQLVSYTVHDCGEANISGDDVVGPIFTLDVHNVNIFRGNSCIHTNQTDIKLDKMLMAKFQFMTNNLNFTAKHYQHIELAGEARERHLDVDKPHQIDISQLK